jgi:hypothetical protein
MIVYKDQSYCKGSRNPCINTKCYRFLSEEEEARANSLDLPISFLINLHTNCEDIVKDD